ncbi:hypothetical protein GCM10025868_36680 [Angustibacter aerolatus]|uniref:Uncharacterized protein n=1 Tax=Angustibacter aerolatus TaxID=1162965 RepID=A0ABQ6JK92_9ACTN|nr:hypothetical protein [Angustibacter aerolatus]GMA88418.1 hypothetical protein GCM10025868_36680 [Angustibacter aerolatus]
MTVDVEAPDAETVWRPGRPVGVHVTLATLRRSARDPAYRHDRVSGVVWRATRTPLGPATVRLEPRAVEAAVAAQAWGPGAGWVIESVPAMLGAHDDDSGFEPRHDLVGTAWRAAAGWRVPRTGLVIESLAPACVEQPGHRAGGVRRVGRDRAPARRARTGPGSAHGHAGAAVGADADPHPVLGVAAGQHRR